MASLDELLGLLAKALREPIARKATIARFQTLVWDRKEPAVPPAVDEVLRDLAHDLDFFEADPVVRKEDGVYYGHTRAEEEIRTALRKVRDMGVDLPTGIDWEG
jgi:hypothetical protein